MLRRLILKLTYRLWHGAVCRVLACAYEERVINSQQWHALSARMDRTQPAHFRVWPTRRAP